MRLLLDDRLAPLTSEIGFLEIGCVEAARAFAEWQTATTYTQIRREAVAASSVEEALRRLLPLTSIVPTRSMFIPTKGHWTAYFANGLDGADAAAPMSYLAKLLGCRGLRVVAVPDTSTRSKDHGRYGATILELYGPEDREFLNYERTIAAVNDGGKWQFAAAGTPQPFEEPSQYKARAVRDRFTFHLLARYLKSMGVDAFSEEYYVVSDVALVERRTGLPEELREFTLEAARAKF